MCLLLKKHFYRPLKMLYRYKSKWYMPKRTQQMFGSSKAKHLQKDKHKLEKKMKNQIVKVNKSKRNVTERENITINIKPQLLTKKQGNFFRKKLPRIKITKSVLKLRNKKKLLKLYLTRTLNKEQSSDNYLQRLNLMLNSLNILKKYKQKIKAIKTLDNIKKIVLAKYMQNQILKKRLKNTLGFSNKYYLNYPAMQNNILTTISLINRRKKLKKIYSMLNYLKVKQSLHTYLLNQKEINVYNEDILDSNFLEPNLREIYGITPARDLSDYYISNLKKTLKNKAITSHATIKKALRFRLKKKNKYKKIRDKMYYKKRRISFGERSYNRLGLNDIKHTKLKWKKSAFSLLTTTVKKENNFYQGESFNSKVKNAIKIYYKKKIKLLFLHPQNLIKKLRQNLLLRSKVLITPIIKKSFERFTHLLKLQLRKNNKIIKKYTRRILFFKKQKGIYYKKKKIEVLNLRDLYIRENQKLREELKAYKYMWKTSSLLNLNQTKQSKLNLIIELRKKKRGLFNILKKYPEGFLAFKERLKMNQYYTGLSLLKRKLE